MESKLHIKLKIRALFLLVVFSLNTLAGFACSIGIDMGYNAHHHSHESMHGNGHHKHHHHHAVTSAAQLKGVSDDCCAGEVTAFNTMDKSVACPDFSLQVPQFLLAFTASFFHPAFELKTTDPSAGHIAHLRRSWRLHDDTDIRIAIQSFQI